MYVPSTAINNKTRAVADASPISLRPSGPLKELSMTEMTTSAIEIDENDFGYALVEHTEDHAVAQ
jgi:hypothetical protein